MRTEIAPLPQTQSVGNTCVWNAPDGAYRVELDPDLVQELRYAAIQAFLALPKRGLEIGGLLLGRMREGRPTVFELTGFEEVPCEHRFGPAYTLDDPDRVVLTTTIARYPQEGAVIGFYRSYTGRDGEPDQADRELVQSFFHARKFACLVLQLDSRDSCLADFRFWNDGEMQSRQTRPMFQFDPAQMERDEATARPPSIVSHSIASDGLTRSEPLPGLPPAASTVSTVLSEPQEVGDRSEHLHRVEFRSPSFLDRQSKEVESEEPNTKGPLWLRLSAILLFIAAAVSSVLLYELRTTDHFVPSAAVNLDARPDVGGFLLTWDAKSPVVGNASRGSLDVDDGKKSEVVQLTKEQLLLGSMTYPDTGSNVLFSLNLDDGETTIGKASLRVMTRAEATNSPAAPEHKLESTLGTEATLTGSDSATGEKAAKPASIRREIHPQIPAGIRRRIATPKVVEVQVRIDKRGRVTSATSQQVAGNSVDRYLSDQAVKAARQWLFWPAKSAQGDPVTTTKTIPFEFMPNERP